LPEKVVVVGASLAGLRAAQTLRKQGHEGELVVVGAEPEMPYTRPPLSKELLAGAQEAPDVVLPLMKCEADWRLGVAATALDAGARRLTLAGGETLDYDALIVATGARPRPWPGDGVHELEGVHLLRDVGDALALREAFASGRPRVAIVGAGFIGCEVAATARGLGLEVTLVDIAPHPMTVLGPELGERCAALHREHGVDLRLGTGVEGFDADGGRVAAVALADGTRVEADVVVVALGALPNTEWLTGSGLQLGPGVRCDDRLAALGAEGVWAAGDAATWPHPLAGGDDIRIEHWTNAAEQGVHAAKNVLGADEPYAAVPYFWSDQHGVKIQAVGLASRAQHVEVLEEDGDGRFVAVGSRDGTVVFACAFGAPRRLMPYRKALADPPRLEDLRATVAADPKRLGAPA
jgi:3-phenylpropionate/trans-cinnamate dioxygenase ferredoxin reductase component